VTLPHCGPSTSVGDDGVHGRRNAIALLGLTALAAGLASPRASGAQTPRSTAADHAQDDHAIRALITRMQAAWNRGDFHGYMDGFLNPGVIFVSKGVIKTGWQDTLDHYIRDYGAPGRRGVLTFSDIQIDVLGPDAAQLVSHYTLQKPVDPQDGVNTRLMRKVAGRWVIALNHVSSKSPPPRVCG
jgi:uncharacterized protein (TIGR02246 family)